MRGTLREFHVTLDNGLEHQLLEVTFHLVINLVGQAQTRIVHGEQEAFYLELRIHARLHYLYRVEELADALQGEVLALHGDDDAIGGSQGVDRDEAKAGAAVDEDVVVVLHDGLQQIPQDALLVLEVEQLYLCAHQVDVRRNDVEPFDVCSIYNVADVHLSKQSIVDGVLNLAHVDAHAAGGIGLRVSIDEEHFLLERGKRGCKVHARCGLAHTSLLVDDGYGLTHTFLYILSTFSLFYFAKVSKICETDTLSGRQNGRSVDKFALFVDNLCLIMREDSKFFSISSAN